MFVKIALSITDYRTKKLMISDLGYPHPDPCRNTILTWTLTFGTERPKQTVLDPDQTPRSAASNKGLHCLLRLIFALLSTHPAFRTYQKQVKGTCSNFITSMVWS